MPRAFSDVNIASKKPTKISSIYDPKVNEEGDILCCNSTYAVDGDKTSWRGEDLFCAHTRKDDTQQPWWAVDLLNVYDINVIDIYGRTDGLSITAHACGYVGYGYVGPAIGTSVANSDIIHCTLICFTNTACNAAEYDKKTNVCTLKGDCTAFADINIASKKPSKMSSIYDPKVGEGVDYLCCNSSYALDGVMPNPKRQAFEDFLCAHTHRNDNQQQWWTVDLQNIYDISVINIYGREDCCHWHTELQKGERGN
ncbi:uncharacterized protein [Mytilus edulis]|uniref:uncharacterized protein n=1 Tax=Mytilus edulis TaxID=6550 RepID=UPI0039EE8AC2